MKMILLTGLFLLISSSFAQIVHEFDELPKVQRKILKKAGKSKEIKPLFYTALEQAADLFNIEKRDGLLYIDTNVGMQMIVKADKLDKELIARSNWKNKPIEVLTISAVLKEKEYHYGDYYTDESLNSINSDIVINAIQIFMTKFEEETGDRSLQYIRIRHSHPVFDAYYVQKNMFVWKYLSSDDAATAKLLSRTMRVPVLISATLPNEYTYAAIFNQGINVTK